MRWCGWRSCWQRAGRQPRQISLGFGRLSPVDWQPVGSASFCGHSAWKWHSPGKLTDFLDHLNSVHENVQFTMEMERDSHLSFLDINIYHRPDGSLGYKAHYKPTRTNLYLSSNSHHHPSNKQAVLTTLVYRSRSLKGSFLVTKLWPGKPPWWAEVSQGGQVTNMSSTKRNQQRGLWVAPSRAISSKRHKLYCHEHGKIYTVQNCELQLKVNNNIPICQFFTIYTCISTKHFPFWRTTSKGAELLFTQGWPPFVDDFAWHPVLPTHLPDRIVHVTGGSYTHVHTLPRPKWH
jgi:hypothetical protein